MYIAGNITPTKASYVKFETKIPDGDHAVRIYGFDVFSAKVSGINDNISTKTNVYPSALNKGETLYINNLQAGKITVYSAAGMLVHSQYISENAQIQLNIPAGIYIVKVNAQGIENVDKIIVK